MADDEVRPSSEPPRSSQATPNRGEPRPSQILDDTAEDLGTSASDPVGSAEAVMPVDVAAETPADRADDPTVHEPSMAAAAADLAAGAEPSPGAAERIDRPHEAAPAAVAARRSRLPGLLAALGVLLVLLLGAVLYTLYNPPNGDATAALRTEVDDLRQRLAAVEARPAPAAPDMKPLQDRSAALDRTTGALKSDLAALDAKVTNLAGAAASGSQSGGDQAALQAKVADLDKGLTALQGTAEARTADLGEKIAAVQAALSALPHVDLAPLDSRIADLDRRLKPVEAELAAPKSDQQVTEARQEGSAAETRAAPLAVTAQATLAAIQAGKPFEVEVKALQALGVSGARLASLQPLAAPGAPTDAALLSGFGEVEGGILGAGRPGPSGSVLERMMAGAEGLVKIRPAGTLAGSDPGALVSRIEGKLKTGDLSGALAEWTGLPADAKAASQAWADRLKGRVDAEAAARGIAAEAIAAIAAAR